MIDPKMQALIDAPLADAVRINLPEGKRPASRSRPPSDIADDTDGGLRLTKAQVAERKQKAAKQKLAKLFDHYAATALSPERVAERLGLYRQVQTGADDKGKLIFERVLDVERARSELAWRRRAAA